MGTEEKYDCLLLKNQLCFPLYACSREVVKLYKPFLDGIGLTYTQYITMMVLWERKRLNVKEAGDMLRLDSGTLTPVLKKLEEKGLLTRRRSEIDERNLIIEITPEGEALKEDAADIPEKLAACVSLEPEDAKQLYRLLYKLMEGLEG